jgi:hypothetical protein
MVSFGWGSTLSLNLPGPYAPSVAGARTVTFFSPNGYLRGAPQHDGNVLGLLQGLARMHFRYVEFDGATADVPDFDQNGLGVLSIEAGISEPLFGYNLALLGPRDVFVLRHFPTPGDPPPCQRMLDGSGIYVEVGNPLDAPFARYTFVCPGRKPLYYHRTAPLPESITHDITGEPRRRALALFKALRAEGIRGVQFDSSLSSSPYVDPAGLSILATLVKLPSLPYSPATNGPDDAFLLLHVPLKGDAPPCVRLPDGSGIYLVRGNAVIPFNDYTFYCPFPSPHFYKRGG